MADNMLSRLLTPIFEGIKSLGNYGIAMGRSEAGPLFWGRVILMGDAFLVSIFLIKKFGLAAVGTYTLANIAVTLLALFCGFGLNYSLPRESMTNPQRNTVTLVWSGLLAPVSLLLIIAYAWVMAENRQEIWEISLFATAGFFAALTNVANTLFLLQKRIHLSLIFPVVHTAGLLVGIIFSRTVIQFALALMVFRALGSFIPFVLLNYSRVSLANILRCGIRGCGFLPSDMLVLFSEQSGPLILSQLLSRGDLGMFGLCRQALTAGDVPGWSFMQSKYPQLVETKLWSARETFRQNVKLSFLMSILILAGSCVLGFFIYHLPIFCHFMVLLVLVIPSRYNNCFYDQVIKSAGKNKLNSVLSGIKFLIAVPLFFILGKSLGVWGAVIGLAGLSVFSDILYRKSARSLYPETGNLPPSLGIAATAGD